MIEFFSQAWINSRSVVTTMDSFAFDVQIWINCRYYKSTKYYTIYCWFLALNSLLISLSIEQNYLSPCVSSFVIQWSLPFQFLCFVHVSLAQEPLPLAESTPIGSPCRSRCVYYSICCRGGATMIDPVWRSKTSWFQMLIMNLSLKQNDTPEIFQIIQ